MTDPRRTSDRPTSACPMAETDAPRPAGRSRRQALAAFAAGAAATMLAPGVVLITGAAPGAARPPGTPASPAQRWGLLIELGHCADGCARCVEACQTEHGWHAGDHGAHDPHWIRLVSATDDTHGRTLNLPLMCQHCAAPPCRDVCPTHATFRRADGIVLVDRHRCIGCRYCVMACPFSARFFTPGALTDQRPHMPRGQGTAEGCTLCVHRIDQGQIPACVEACAAAGGGAMRFGDLADPDDPIRAALAELPTARLRPDLGLGTAVHYGDL